MRILFSVLGIGLFAQLAFGQQFVRKQELSIYALVIRDVRRLEGDWAGKARKLVVLSQTMKGDKRWVETAGESTRGLVKNFERVNNQSLILPDSLAGQCRCDLLSETELAGILDKGRKETERLEATQKVRGIMALPSCDDGWQYFSAKFPDVNQYYKLSRIGYSASGKFAFVETDGIGACSDSNCTHLLKRTTKGWRIYRRGGGGRGVS